jgi:hypothetical protein
MSIPERLSIIFCFDNIYLFLIIYIVYIFLYESLSSRVSQNETDSSLHQLTFRKLQILPSPKEKSSSNCCISVFKTTILFPSSAF